ncbi:unnamed protein product [Symbiodinium natans]|uniref:C3H1-type domain-containing protein n=1 Tax=Symbiodinium natans TaxID=878477 RepID=A0A812LVQ9_9DINO|nr:unnamed protein product [Symbiodinium natans]
MDDAGALRWCQWASQAVPAFVHEKQLRKPAEDTLIAACVVDFSGNKIGDKGCHSLLSLLFELRIGADKLKLHRNHLGRAAGQTLMHFLGQTEHPLNELHLSHNFITREGAVDILKGVAWNPRYPATLRDSLGRLKYVPLWLRLETNMISDPDGLLVQAEQKMHEARRSVGEGHQMANTSEKAICEIWSPDSGLCSATRCDYAHGAHCAMVHLTYPRRQRLPAETKVPPEAKAWRDRPGEAASWALPGSKAAPPVRPKPPPKSSAPAGAGFAAPLKKALAPCPWAEMKKEAPGAVCEAQKAPPAAPAPGLVKCPPPLHPSGVDVVPLPKQAPKAAPKHAWQTADLEHPPLRDPPCKMPPAKEQGATVTGTAERGVEKLLGLFIYGLVRCSS